MNLFKRTISMILALVLLLGNVPAVYAAEAETLPVTEAPETTAAVTEAVETTAAPEMEAVEETAAVTEEMTEAPEETAVSTEETIFAETIPEETLPEETVVEETIPEETEAPSVIPGLPEGWALSEAQLERKQQNRDNGVLETLMTLTAGEDYVADELLLYAETEEEAAAYAAAFGGELVCWLQGLTQIRLADVSVAEAVEASLAGELLLPAASPNYIGKPEPQEEILHISKGAAASAAVPEEEDWEHWVKDIGIDDPWLQKPYERDFQWIHDAVDTYAAWNVTTGVPSVTVALISYGVGTTTPELSDKISAVDIGCGTEPTANHTSAGEASLIAAEMDNGVQGVGIAPDVKLLSIRVNSSTGTVEDVNLAKAIYSAVAKNASIITIGTSSHYYNVAIQDAVNYAYENGVTVIAAAGDKNTNATAYPAACDNVLAVAAVDHAGYRAGKSSFGSWVDVSAPGEYILSVNTRNAASVVAGAAALYMSAQGGYAEPDEVIRALTRGVTAVKEKDMGRGMINLAKILGGKPEKPFYTIYDGELEQFVDGKKPLYWNSALVLAESEDEFYGLPKTDAGSVLLVTTDGKTPSVKNGEIIQGQVVETPYILNLSEFVNKTVTVKAAWVSGTGVMGNVLSLKLKVGPFDQIFGVSVQGVNETDPVKVVAGKSVTFKAVVEPAEYCTQKVNWGIVYRAPGLEAAKITSSGKLTTPAGKSGLLVIGVASADDPTVGMNFKVEVTALPPVAKMALSSSQRSIYIGKSVELSVYKMEDKAGNAIDPADVSVAWSSSKPAVATVDQNGKVTAVAPGSATITCAALDGSGKKATCKITVLQPAEDVEITGPRAIAPGGTGSFKAKVLPLGATYKKVTWSLSGTKAVLANVKIDAKTGKVTVGKNAGLNTSFMVVATSQDGFANRVYDVWIQNPYKTLNMKDQGYKGYGAAPVRDKNGNTKEVTLYSTDVQASSAEDNKITLYVDGWAESNATRSLFQWTSNKPAVASVDEFGRVTAHQAGIATITCTATDGSKKKATCKVTVQTPASSFALNSSIPLLTGEYRQVALGATVTHTVVLGDAYGKPTNTKVSWSYDALILNDQGWVLHDITNQVQKAKAVTLTSAGKMTVKKNLADIAEEYGGTLVVSVTAKSSDHAYSYDVINYTIVPMVTRLVAKEKVTNVKTSSISEKVYFYSDQNCGFTVTSANPLIAYAEKVTYVGYEEGKGHLYYINVIPTGKTGSAKFTVKPTDGSKKTLALAAKLVN